MSSKPENNTAQFAAVYYWWDISVYSVEAIVWTISLCRNVCSLHILNLNTWAVHSGSILGTPTIINCQVSLLSICGLWANIRQEIFVAF